MRSLEARLAKVEAISLPSGGDDFVLHISYDIESPQVHCRHEEGEPGPRCTLPWRASESLTKERWATLGTLSKAEHRALYEAVCVAARRGDQPTKEEDGRPTSRLQDAFLCDNDLLAIALPLLKR